MASSSSSSSSGEGWLSPAAHPFTLSSPIMSCVYVGAVLACALSAYSVAGHYWRSTSWRAPNDELRLVHVCVLLAPVTIAVLSLLALVAPALAIWCEVPIAVYEAAVLYLYMRLVLLHIGGNTGAIKYLEEAADPDLTVVCLWRFSSPQAFLSTVRILVMQYLFVKPGAIMLLAVLEMTVRDPTMLQRLGRILGMVVPALAVVVAVVSVVRLYRALYDGLGHFQRGIMKLVAIKLAVFLVTAQRGIVGLLVGEFPPNVLDEQSHAIVLARAILIIEMPFYALLLYWLFRASEHDDPNQFSDQADAEPGAGGMAERYGSMGGSA